MNIIEKRRVEEEGREEGGEARWGTSGGIYIFKRSEQFVAFPTIQTVRGNWPLAARPPPIHPPQTGSCSCLLKSGRGRKEARRAASHGAAPRTDPEEGEIPPLAGLSQSRCSQSHNRPTIEAAMCGGRCERRAAPQFSAGTKRSSSLCSGGRRIRREK